MPSIFDYLNSINNKQPIEIEKDFSGYMITLWLSHLNNHIEKVNSLNNVLFKVPDKSVYDYFYDKIPKKKRYIKYVKKQKIKENKALEDYKYNYNLSNHEINKYKEFMNES